MKKCPQCRRILDIDKFNRNRTTKDGYYCYCRECIRTYKKKKYHDTQKYKVNELIREEKKNLKMRGLQKCSICLKIKHFELFRYRNGACRKCENMRNMERYNQNPDKVNLQRRSIYWQNHDEIRKRLNKHRRTVRDRVNKWAREYRKNRMQNNIQFAMRIRLRDRLNKAIKNKYEKGIAVKYLGCTIKYFKEYIENQFVDGMNWNNWGRDGWHLDHIEPLSKFDLTNKEQLIKVCHYRNLQPLWAKDNLSKGDKKFILHLI